MLRDSRKYLGAFLLCSSAAVLSVISAGLLSGQESASGSQSHIGEVHTGSHQRPSGHESAAGSQAHSKTQEESPGLDLRVPEITPENFDDYVRLIKPTPDESYWSLIPWMTDLYEARKKAAAEGKPLVVWTMSGEPMGFC